MHPLVSQTVAAEHVRDMRVSAAAARQAKLTRRTRRSRSASTLTGRLRTLGA